MQQVKQNRIPEQERVRNLAQLSVWIKQNVAGEQAITDIDGVFVHRHYEKGICHEDATEPIRLVEFKVKGGHLEWHQRRTFNRIDEALRLQLRPSEYLGYWCVSFDGLTPQTSRFAEVSYAPKWSRRRLTLDELAALLSSRDNHSLIWD